MTSGRVHLALITGVVLLSASCSGGPNTSAPEREAPSPAIESSALSPVLLQHDEGPADLTFDRVASGAVSASYLESELAGPGERWPPRGFVEAAHHLFLMERPVDPEGLSDQDVRGLMNLGILFEDAETATAYLRRSFPPEFVLREAEPYGYDSLGDERRGLRTEASADRPIRTTVIWRRGNLFLQLNVFGDYSVEEIMGFATAVDARADDVAPMKR